MVDLSIILVNFNTAFHTLNCIESVVSKTYKMSYEIIVVDNDSKDNSYNLIITQFPNIVWIQNDTNEGFGRANNIGINKSKGRFILLLNTDTIVIENSLNELFDKFLQESNDVAAATCQLLNTDGSLQRSIFYFNASFKEILSYNLLVDKLFPNLLNKPNEIASLHGACIIFNKSILTNIGFFDSDFFLYSEEFEWCYRIRKANKKLHFYDNTRIYHKEEVSSSNKDWNIKQRLLSNALLFKKTRGSLGLVLYMLLQTINSLTNFIFLLKMTKSYRKDYFKNQRLFWTQFWRYVSILFDCFEKPLKAR
jgi:GT2 family glycosyltransferase